MFDIHFMYVVILASCLVDLSRLRVIQSPNRLISLVSGKACSKRFVVNAPAVKVQLISSVKMYSLPTCQIMTHVAHHMSHICWEGNLATLYGSIRSVDD